MGYSVIRYGVKNGSIEENRDLVEKVFEELNRSAPAALQYLVLELEDGEFVHVVGEENGRVSAAAARRIQGVHGASWRAPRDPDQPQVRQDRRQLPHDCRGETGIERTQ